MKNRARQVVAVHFPVPLVLLPQIPAEYEVKEVEMEMQAQNSEKLDPDGFLREITEWTRETAHELARRNDLGPLTESHWKIIDYVRDYYHKHGEGPPIVKIGKATGFTSGEICKMFPCGVARGAYRLAGLPRPNGCV